MKGGPLHHHTTWWAAKEKEQKMLDLWAGWYIYFVRDVARRRRFTPGEKRSRQKDITCRLNCFQVMPCVGRRGLDHHHHMLASIYRVDQQAARAARVTLQVLRRAKVYTQRVRYRTFFVVPGQQGLRQVE